MCLLTWVDNLFCIADSQDKAARCLRRIEQVFESSYGLRIKPSSKLYLLPKGALDEGSFTDEWQRVEQFPVLGHIIAANASIHPCWEASQRTIWRAFWKNCRSHHLKREPQKRMQLLDRSVFPAVSYRVSRWPPQKVVAQQLDRVQVNMIASIRKLPPLPFEEPGHFNNRRMKDAHSFLRQTSTWSSRWFNRFHEWNEHLSRHPDHPASRILATRGSEWLRRRRANYAATNPVRWNSWTSLAGRTNTRVCRGHVAM